MLINGGGEVQYSENGENITLTTEGNEILLNRFNTQHLNTIFNNKYSRKVKTEERYITLQGEIDESTVADVQDRLLRVAIRIVESGDIQPIILIISSPGGDVDAGITLIESIEQVRGMGVGENKIPVIGLIQGISYSMAGVILQACTLRMMSKHSRMMIHEISGGILGKLTEMNDSIKEFKEMLLRMSEIFAERNTAKEADKHTSKFWVRYMQGGKDSYLSARECIELGVLDSIYNPLDNADFDYYLNNLKANGINN